MRLYRSAEGVLFVPGTINPKACDRIEVPTDSQGLCHWLNEYRRELLESSASAPAEPPPPASAAAAPAAPVASVDGIIEFILDGATVAQVEQVFAALGCRFAEQRIGYQQLRAVRP